MKTNFEVTSPFHPFESKWFISSVFKCMPFSFNFRHLQTCCHNGSVSSISSFFCYSNLRHILFSSITISLSRSSSMLSSLDRHVRNFLADMLPPYQLNLCSVSFYPRGSTWTVPRISLFSALSLSQYIVLENKAVHPKETETADYNNVN